MRRLARNTLAVGGRSMIGRLTVPVAVGACRRFGDAAKPQEAAAGAGATVPAAEGAGATVPAAAGAPAGDKTATPPKVQELVDRILELNVLEVNQLLFRLQTRLGISDAQIASSGGGGSAAGPAAGAPSAAAPAAAAAPPKETVDIKIGAVDAKAKIKIIKEVRVITGLGLAESKALVEKAPVVIKEGLKKEEAEKLKKLLTDAGAVVELL